MDSNPTLATGMMPIATNVAIVATPVRKGIDLAVLRRGARDYLDFLDHTKETFYAYLYHRTGSQELARTLLLETYLDVLSRAMSLWWFGALTMRTLMDSADRTIRGRTAGATADLDSVYLASLPWFSDEEKRSVSTLHDALWTLPASAQRILILSFFVGASDETIAQSMGASVAEVHEQRAAAQEFLFSRWQPPPDVRAKMNSLVFLPSLDVASETKLRFAVVEKYNALRFRRYQWVVLAGLFAVMSNVIVAGLILFTVVVAPPTSLRTTRTQIASLDAVLIERQAATGRFHAAVTQSIDELRGLAAHEATSTLTDIGLSAARNVVTDVSRNERDLAPLLRTLRSASLALLRMSIHTLAYVIRGVI